MKKIGVLILLMLLSLKTYAYDAAGYQAKITELEGLLAQCESMGMECPYEEVSITSMKQFTNPSVLSNTDYIAARMDEIYADTKAKLDAYIEGTKKPVQAPKYLSSRVTLDGTSMIADTTWGKRPVFFLGYGHFDPAVEALPQFQNIGANITQQVIYPYQIVTSPKRPLHWNVSNSGQEGIEGDITYNYTAMYANGTASAKMEMTAQPNGGQVRMSQKYEVEPNTTYNFSLRARTKSDNKAFFEASTTASKVTINSTSRLTKYSGTFTTGEETTQTFLVTISGVSTCYIDDIVVTKEGSEENLIKNGDFEVNPGEEVSETQDFYYTTAYIEDTIIPMLESAEENNVSVDLLISSLYAPGVLLEKYPDISCFDEEYQEVIDNCIAILIPMIKDYKALNSICISNEPYINSSEYDIALPLYHTYLSEQYTDISALNAAYGTSYSEFGDVPEPTEASETRYFYDWMIFNNDLFTKVHKRFADKIKEYMPDAKIHSKLMDHFDVDSTIDFARYRMTVANEAENWAEFSDINGNDSYALYTWRGGRSIEGQLKWYDYLTSVKDAPAFNSEDHIMDDYCEIYDTNMAKFTRASTIQSAIRGRTATAYWSWFQTKDTSSLYSGNLMQRPDYLVAIGKSTLDLNRLAYEVTALNKSKARVAVICSNVDRVYDDTHYSHVDLIYKAALYSGQKIRFITDKKFNTLKNYDVLIVPGVNYISDENLEYVEAFKNSGKKVILLDECFNYDDFGKQRTFSGVGYDKKSIPNIGESDLTYWSDLIFNALGKDTVKLCDENGEFIHGVEWSWTTYNGKVIINACNYTDNDITGVKVLYNNEPIATTDLISLSDRGTSFTLTAYEPVILEYAPKYDSVIKSINYDDVNLMVNLYNPYSALNYIKGRVSAYSDGTRKYAMGVSGEASANENIKFKFYLPAHEFDKIVLEIFSEGDDVLEERVIYRK